MLASQGYKVVNRVLSVHTRRATAEERKQLALPRGASVLHLERLRLARRDPLIYSLDVLPAVRVLEELPPGTELAWAYANLTGALFLSGRARLIRPALIAVTVLCLADWVLVEDFG